MSWPALEVPIVLAPLAGGPATVELAAAVSEAGGLGFLAAGYMSADALRDQLDAAFAATRRPFGVNVFAPPAGPADPATVAAYARRIGATSEPRFDDDDWDAKLDRLHERTPAVVSFVFGCPPAGVITDLRDRGACVWVTVTHPDEAVVALEAGADAVVAQGLEAGGHRGGWLDREQLGLLTLLQRLPGAPVVAAGGIATGHGVAAALAAGASAAAVGTAFLRTPEAGTNAAHRAALAEHRATALTRAFTGKPGRGLVNDFMLRHEEHAPAAYPEVHYLTAPLRAAARERGDAEAFNLWAGQAYRLARDEPAAAVVSRLAQKNDEIER